MDDARALCGLNPMPIDAYYSDWAVGHNSQALGPLHLYKHRLKRMLGLETVGERPCFTHTIESFSVIQGYGASLMI